MDLEVVENKSSIELYADLINDSLKIDCNPLISSLDEILLIFNNYFILIDKVLFFVFQFILI